MKAISLNGTWSVRSDSFDCTGETGLRRVTKAGNDWLEARVPGEIHLDLMNAGMLPDPSVGANMPECRDPETKSWWFCTDFVVDGEFLRHERQALVFEGLDLYAQIFINGKLAGESADAFVPVRIEAMDYLQKGKNDLVVRLTAGSELAADDTPPGQGQIERRSEAASGGSIPNPLRESDLYSHRNWPGKKWLRKPQFSYGWDWVDALPNIGIWRGVSLQGRSHAILHDIRLDTVLNNHDVSLELEAAIENLHPWSERSCTLRIEIQPPDHDGAILYEYPVDAPPGRTYVRDTIDIPSPLLWWPNEMGKQPMYGISAEVTDPEGNACDSRRFSIGLRSIEIDRSRLSEGSRFCIRVNGEEVFCRGANIGPHDAILARISDDKYRALVSEAQNAHMTMLRINGCPIYEGSAFYEACDRAGILIWHDVMLTCTTYPDDDEKFAAAIQAETETAVRLLRHHPSIALWCGNNECTWAFRDWWNPDKEKPLELGGAKLYNQLLPELCDRLDPRRPYLPSSPCGGEAPNSELDGDCHWWFPFFMNADINRRIRPEVFDECRSRFVSEYGVIGPCHLDSIREYMGQEEIDTGSKAWKMHTNTFEKETVPAAIRLHYSEPEQLSLPEYVQYGQMFQAIVHGRAMEALRFRKGDASDDCRGALIWSYSDCWGETGWSILDYYLRRKASYYWFRRACAPVKVIVRRRGDTLVGRIVNDTLRPFSGSAEIGWWRLDGGAVDVELKRGVQVPANSMLEVGGVRIPAAETRDPQSWLCAALLRDPDGTVIDQSTWQMLPFRELATIDNPEIKVEESGSGLYNVSSNVYCHGVHIEDHGREVISDNWFDLLPGILVQVHSAAPLRAADFGTVTAEGRGATNAS